MRWGEPFIGTCCHFFIQLSVPLLQNEKVEGCLSASPFLMIDPSDLEITEIARAVKDHENEKGLLKALSSVPVVPAHAIGKAAQGLFQVGDSLSDPGFGYLLKVREVQHLQGRIADSIGDLKDLSRDLDASALTRLSFEQETELRSRIGRGDRAGAEEILYSLLAINLTQYLDDLELLKVSMLELFAILSRVAVELGAKTEDILGMRYIFLAELASVKGHENICLWLVQAFERFIGTLEATRRVRTDDRLQKAIELIEKRYSEPLTVERIAREVCLSPSRLSHIVQRDLGITLKAYTTKIRVEKAKVLLLGTDLPISQIAVEVGYPDQSYFTKSFKSVEKCTPKTFRKSGFLTGLGSGLTSVKR